MTLPGVYALKHTRMLVENTLAGPLPAVTVLPMTRDDTKGVYDLEHTHACGAHARSVTPCCCITHQRQGVTLLRGCLWCVMTLTVCMLSSAHMCVDRTLAGTRLAVVAMSPTRYDTKGV